MIQITSPTLLDYRDRHAGETIVVCGCGSSLSGFRDADRFVTIGVNDVGRLFDPTYLVVLNPRSQFKADRFRFVEESGARAIFSQLELGIRHPELVRLRLGVRGGTAVDASGRVPHAQNSPYVAMVLALFMGARRIGLVGVDFTRDHFFAATGRHPLERKLAGIDREYARLAAECERRGVEVVNLSPQSRLTAFPKGALPAAESVPVEPAVSTRRVFFVDYPFLSCGDVFETGLRHAADALAVESEHARWDDPALPSKVARFRPDLLFVVHGRKFAQRWRGRFPGLRKAVWLVDEPYEVDDCARWSGQFEHVFVNDPVTLDRHPNAVYLPVAHDPQVHRDPGRERPHALGFVGGYSPTRERRLHRLLDEDLLSYVVGGPWRSPRLRALCLAPNVPAARTTELYQETRLVLNVFRDRHHFNRRGTPGSSLNPRVYEALACGALVVSEPRPELASVFPEVPTFRSDDELVGVVRALLADSARQESLRRALKERVTRHGFAERLQRVLASCPPQPPPAAPMRRASPTPAPAVLVAPRTVSSAPEARTLFSRRAGPAPLVSIVTTVSDGVDSLRECLRTVARSELTDIEHLVVADGPAPAVLDRIAAVVRAEAAPRVQLSTLARRHGRWTIAAAATGLRQARGRYVAFLLDPHGYRPGHLGPLVEALEAGASLGFCYSSCEYDGRRVLDTAPPRAGQIDLGQLLFRRELFQRHLGGGIPFDQMAWDWRIVETLLAKGVRWRHLDRRTFLHGLTNYPRDVPESACCASDPTRATSTCS